MKQTLFFDYLISKCPDIKYLLDKIQSSSQYEVQFQHFINQYIAIKGHVQSGKTNFMLCASVLMIWHGVSMVIVTRNLQSDVSQLLSRWEEMKPIPHLKVKIIKSSTSKKKVSGPALFICLGNNSSLERIRTLTKGTPYMVLVDEVDSMDIARDSFRSEQLTLLKQSASCVFGISATMMEPLSKETILPKHIILLKPNEDYKGMEDITFHALHMPSKFIATIKGNILEENHDLMPFLQEFQLRPPNEFPIIGLINVCRTIQPYLELQKQITEDMNLTTLVYHGKGITLGYENKIEHRADTISEVLSWLKTNGGVERFPRILIFSGDLAGRGISFTDKEYEWHLRVLYLIVASTTDEPELIQKIRLCGRYQDNHSLELYTTQEIYIDLMKAYHRQEEIVSTLLSKESEESECKTIMSNMVMYKEKFTKRKMTKHTELLIQKTNTMNESEWSMDCYPEADTNASNPTNESKDNDRNDHELKRLSQKMFPNWASHIGTTRISLWLDALDPEYTYSKSEMVLMCKQFNITLQHLIVPKYQSGSNGYGKLLWTEHNVYRLHPELVESHKKYFSIRK